jgi:hypothetical protein
MKETLTQRPARFVTRRDKLSGGLAARGLGSLQPATSHRRVDHFPVWIGKPHTHSWLHGTTHSVCSLCGHTVPREKPGTD